MSIEAVTNEVVAICIDSSELHGQTRITGKKARDLVRRALESRGEKMWKDIVVDLFRGEGVTLLLARPARPRLHCFGFDDFESLLCAAGCLDDDIPSSLTYYNGVFQLQIEELYEMLSPALFEYGRLLQYDADMCAHLEEHGERIIDVMAVRFLKSCFKRV